MRAEEEITEFLEPLLARLGEVLAARRSVDSQLSALGAISSAAYAAGGGFAPYAAAVLPLLRQYMGVTEVRPGLAHALESPGVDSRISGPAGEGNFNLIRLCPACGLIHQAT
jgi:hypothetical protein